MKETDFTLEPQVERDLPLFFERNMNLFPHFGGDMIPFASAVRDGHGFNVTHFPNRTLRLVSKEDFEDGLKAFRSTRKDSKNGASGSNGKWW